MTGEARQGGLIALLSSRTFAPLWFAGLLANFGTQIHAVGAAWMMASIATSHQLVTLVSTALLLPALLFSLVAGVLADHLDRSLILLAAQMLMAATALLLMLLAWQGNLTPELILICTFLIGCGLTLNAPAWQLALTRIAPAGSTSSALLLVIISMNLARAAGPALGGLLIGGWGAYAGFAVNGLCAILLMAVLWRYRPRIRSVRVPGTQLRGAFIGGFRNILNKPVPRLIVIRAALFGLLAAAFSSLIPLVARELLHGDAEVYGLLLGSMGAGSVAGAVCAPQLLRHISSRHAILLADMLAFGCLVVVAVAPVSWIAAAGLGAGGAGIVLNQSVMSIMMLTAVDHGEQGRALSLFQTGGLGGLAAGSWLWGAVSDHAGIRGALGISAAGFLLLILVVGGAMATRRFRNIEKGD